MEKIDLDEITTQKTAFNSFTHFCDTAERDQYTPTINLHGESKEKCATLRESFDKEMARRDCAIRVWPPVEPQELNPQPRLREERRIELDGFPKLVLKAAKTCETGWKGDDRVFISHVYKNFTQQNPDVPFTLSEFKEKLEETRHKGHITLTRADILSLFKEEDIKESETSHYLFPQFINHLISAKCLCKDPKTAFIQ